MIKSFGWLYALVDIDLLSESIEFFSLAKIKIFPSLTDVLSNFSWFLDGKSVSKLLTFNGSTPSIERIVNKLLHCTCKICHGLFCYYPPNGRLLKRSNLLLPITSHPPRTLVSTNQRTKALQWLCQTKSICETDSVSFRRLDQRNTFLFVLSSEP